MHSTHFILHQHSLSSCIKQSHQPDVFFFLSPSPHPSRTAQENVYTLLQPPRLPGRAGSPGEGSDGTVEEERVEEYTGVMEVRSIQGLPLPSIGENKQLYSTRQVQFICERTIIVLAKVHLSSEVSISLCLFSAVAGSSAVY